MLLFVSCEGEHVSCEPASEGSLGQEKNFPSHGCAARAKQPDVTNRTKSNPITRLGSIEFDNRTQSNPHKKIGLIEPNRTFEWVRLVR